MATITPGYWYCPRCRGKDLYRAPRQVGSVGFGKAFDGFDSDSDAESIGFSQRSLEMQVLLCRNCGERAVYQKQVKRLTQEEQNSSDKKFGIFMFSAALFFFVVGIGSGFAWSTIAGLVFGAFGLLFFSKVRSKNNSNSREPNKICPECKAMRPSRVDAGRCGRVDCPPYI